MICFDKNDHRGLKTSEPVVGCQAHTMTILSTSGPGEGTGVRPRRAGSSPLSQALHGPWDGDSAPVPGEPAVAGVGHHSHRARQVLLTRLSVPSTHVVS